MAATFWFPLKNFLPPVKDQGRRGTCWAFTAIGAVEAREIAQNDNWVNLSEQFLVNEVKETWAPATFDEGGDFGALDLAFENGQTLMPEANWTGTCTDDAIRLN